MDFLFPINGFQLNASISDPTATYKLPEEYGMMLHVDALVEQELNVILQLSQIANDHFKMIGSPVLNEGPRRTYMFEIIGNHDFVINFRQTLGLNGLDADNVFDQELMHQQEQLPQH